jgi:uncharacterized membrane protein
MAHQIIKISILFCILAFVFAGCYYDVEEELYPANTCVTTNVSYTTDVIAILTNNSCIACHNNTSPGGGIKLDTHADVAVYANNGRLYGSVNHQAGYKAMPQGSTTKINQCSIDRLKAWVDAGAPNN